MMSAAAEADRLQNLRGAALALAARDAREHHRQRHILDGGHRRDEIERLENDPDLVAPVLAELFARHLRQVLAEDIERPFGRVVEAREQIQQGRLAGARGAEQTDELAGLDGHGNAVERAHDGRAHPVMLFELADFDRGRHAVAGSLSEVPVG
jgi:hypothetical protein